MPSRRSYLDIVHDILRVALGGARKTRIMYEANLSYRQLKEYLELLLSSRMLALRGDAYHTTEKGRKFIKEYQELKCKLKKNNNNNLSKTENRRG
ncbi:MAG: hypothetical protein J7L11_01270 [Thermoprotei archaeon]|nr:hypothetical protein [Thermoprotei archaeon]